MNIHQIATLSPRQRRFLSELVQGGQALRRMGGYEAYRECDGKTMPMGAKLSQQEMDDLLNVVPGFKVELNALPTQCGPYIWLPSSHRGLVADLLTQTMRSDHLRVEQAAGPRESAGQVLELGRQRA